LSFRRYSSKKKLNTHYDESHYKKNKCTICGSDIKRDDINIHFFNHYIDDDNKININENKIKTPNTIIKEPRDEKIIKNYLEDKLIFNRFEFNYKFNNYKDFNIPNFGIRNETNNNSCFFENKSSNNDFGDFLNENFFNLAIWYVKHKIGNIALNDLIQILIKVVLMDYLKIMLTF